VQAAENSAARGDQASIVLFALFDNPI